MWNRFIAILSLLLGLVVISLGNTSDISEATATQRVCEYVRLRQGLDKGHFLKASRRENLEDDLFAAQVKIRGQIHKAAMIFEITDSGYEIRSPDEVVFHSSVHGGWRWNVAIVLSSGNPYGLGGFDDSLDGFNKLVTDANVFLVSEDSVRAWVSFYLSVAVGNRYGAYLMRAVDLPRQVEDIAEAYSASRKRPLVPARWLKNLEKAGVKPIFGVQIRPEGDKFHVLLHSIAISEARMPVLQQIQFNVTLRGTVDAQALVPLFPRTSADR